MKNLINRIVLFYLKRFYPQKHAQFIGVRLGHNCQICKTIDFGTEPYLISIGNNFYSSENVSFITHDGSVNVIRNLSPSLKNIDYIAPITIGNNVFLGYGVIVLPGSIIEDNVIVGASSLVKGTLKKNSVYAGTPTKLICSIEEYIEKNRFHFIETKHLSAFEKHKYLLKKFKISSAE